MLSTTAFVLVTVFVFELTDFDSDKTDIISCQLLSSKESSSSLCFIACLPKLFFIFPKTKSLLSEKCSKGVFEFLNSSLSKYSFSISNWKRFTYFFIFNNSSFFILNKIKTNKNIVINEQTKRVIFTKLEITKMLFSKTPTTFT